MDLEQKLNKRFDNLQKCYDEKTPNLKVKVSGTRWGGMMTRTATGEFWDLERRTTQTPPNVEYCPGCQTTLDITSNTTAECPCGEWEKDTNNPTKYIKKTYREYMELNMDKHAKHLANYEKRLL